MAKQRWVVTVSGSGSLSDIRKKLVDNGFQVDQVLGEIPLITGVADDDVVAKARKIPGVIDVSPELDVDIGDPDASIS